MSPAVRVLIADDRTRSRLGLRALLHTYSEMEVVGEAADGQEVLRMTEELSPDVVVMDIRMPGMDGLAATRLIKARWPKVRVVVLTMYAARWADAVSAGADEFLLKGGPPDRLLEAIKAK